MANAANGIQMRHPEEHEETNYESRLNAYIYGYFLEREMWDCARSLKDSGAQFEPQLTHVDGDLNGADDKMDTKEGILQKKPPDLPRLPGSKDEQGGPFLLSWFEMFWDIYWAQRKHPRATNAAMSYVQLSQVSWLCIASRWPVPPYPCPRRHLLLHFSPPLSPPHLRRDV